MTEAIFIVIIALEDLLLLLSRYPLHIGRKSFATVPASFALSYITFLSLLPAPLSLSTASGIFVWQLPLATMFMLRNGKQHAFHAPPNPSIHGHLFVFWPF